MRWWCLILSVITLVLLGIQAWLLPLVVTAREAMPSATTTLKLIEHAAHLTDIDHGDPGPSVGDAQVWGPNALYDESDSADTGATTQGVCTALNAEFDCVVTETIIFADGSALQVQGVEFATAPSRRTIVGGSGEYLGATGTVSVEPTQDQSRWVKTIEILLPDDKS